ncbi:MAG: glutaredoxin family protein [Deltaproteobacteria bacterium]|nr:glutaredoxin family protein [Deltaproteobacteria bacterium]MCZ6452105.1 glutaredoxin family protein [Deltaproteobacteria bacterium]MCZ6562589.1 glutaredoxin family protein [Deltaproteobacteria bacterium]
MTRQIRLYTRRDCCLCEEMKGVVRDVAEEIPLEVEEVDVDSGPDLRERFGGEVPVLFIDGRKAFKYRVAARELKKKLRQQ